MTQNPHPRYLQLLENTLPDLNASREAYERINTFIALLEKWNQRINLIRYANTDELWERHILDCARLLAYMPPETQVLTDFGSGGGFPGVILALLHPMTTHLIESDERKCAFLFEAADIISGKTHIHNARIETLIPWESDVLTARALAPLKKLIPLTQGFIAKSKICLFQKGENGVEEVAEAKRILGENTDMDIRIMPLPGTPHSHIISIKGGKS